MTEPQHPEHVQKTSPAKSKKLGARHRARKRAVDLLFEAEARGILASGVPTLVDERKLLAADDAAVAPVSEYTATLALGVSGDLSSVDGAISGHLEQWTMDRLPAVDRAVLRIAVWELFHAVDVPPAVVVDEAVELAKELSTDESPSFINGVLGRMVGLAPQVRAASAAEPPPV